VPAGEHSSVCDARWMAADPGLFGPESVTWRIHADPVMGLGGLRALLLQALHPLAMVGVAQHSEFRKDPWGRLFRTAGYIGATTYGTTDEALAAAAKVRRVHSAVRGVDPTTGAAYSADDPELLLWVHCSLVDSLLVTYRRCGGPLRRGDGDAYVAEQVRMAPLVGLDTGEVPASEAELRQYFRDVRPQLRLTPEARRAALFVLRPPMPGWVGLLTPARPTWVGVTGLAFALLPGWARRMYGLPGAVATVVPTGPAAGVAGRALRAGLLAVPPELRHGPHYKAALARIGADPPVLRRLAALPSRRG
jgi:uncharacterized protein (DUF2236 family)